jgi:hypothetical protein
MQEPLDYIWNPLASLSPTMEQLYTLRKSIIYYINEITNATISKTDFQ